MTHIPTLKVSVRGIASIATLEHACHPSSLTAVTPLEIYDVRMSFAPLLGHLNVGAGVALHRARDDGTCIT